MLNEQRKYSLQQSKKKLQQLKNIYKKKAL